MGNNIIPQNTDSYTHIWMAFSAMTNTTEDVTSFTSTAIASADDTLEHSAEDNYLPRRKEKFR